ncbi:MAG: serine/threonine protein kinase [Deltaproteobacteria bacterium]|nr:serine/threonine protein kinase [Deltaproteobacteria bacterium]
MSVETLPARGPAATTVADDQTMLGQELSADEIVGGEGADLAPGTKVGEYEIERKVGAGGCGVVYLARHPLIGKRAAVKVLAPARAADPVQVDRFLLEARSVNAIGHRNIVDIFAFGKLPDGRTYLVMEFLEGEDLGKHLEKVGRLAPEEVVPILSQLARGLAAAHAKGFVHRDLKPENVFVTTQDGQPQVKLLDFGLTKLADATEATRKTRKGVVMGTPQYMSPEQARGRDVDHRTDIYSLGVVLYECLTGRLPFDSNSDVDILIRHACEAPQPPSLIAPLPAGIDRIVLKCLEKDSARRYASATDVAVDLERTLGLPVVSDRASSPPIAAPIVIEVDRRPIHETISSEPDGGRVSVSALATDRRKIGVAALLGLAILGVLLLIGGLLLSTNSTEAQSVVAATVPTLPSSPPVSPPTVTPGAPPRAAELPAPPLVGQLAIAVKLRGARVSVDGVDVPVLRGVASVADLRAGEEHVVRVAAPGHEPYERSVRIGAGQTSSVEPDLEPAREKAARPPHRGPGAGSDRDGIVNPWE